MDEEEVICSLESTNHLSQFSHAMFEMLENEEMVDVTLSCDDGLVHAHKNVLSSQSSYFKNLFSSLAAKNLCNNPVIIVKGMSLEDLRLLLKYIYVGHVMAPKSKISCIREYGEAFRVNGLYTADTKDVTVKPNQRERSARRKSSHSTANDTVTTDSEDSECSTRDNVNTAHSSLEPMRLLEQTLTIPDQVNVPNHSEDYVKQPCSSNSLFVSSMNTNHGGHSNRENLSLGHVHHERPRFGVEQSPSNLMPLAMFPHMSNTLPPDGLYGLGNQPSLAHISNQASRSQVDYSSRKLYVCPICHKSFSEKANMKRHTEIHSQQRRKYVCDICAKCFSWKDNFLRHRRSAHQT
ncbi:Protein bric-a-brac 2 [Halotydeus destructor]|nr:Protein bric-a-brac 2 [Halotydeus destructor]